MSNPRVRFLQQYGQSLEFLCFDFWMVVSGTAIGQNDDLFSISVGNFGAAVAENSWRWRQPLGSPITSSARLNHVALVRAWVSAAPMQ
jgi:hypothetical protein